MSFPVFPALLQVCAGALTLTGVLLVLSYVADQVGNRHLSDRLMIRFGVPVGMAGCAVGLLGLLGWWVFVGVAALAAFGIAVRPKRRP